MSPKEICLLEGINLSQKRTQGANRLRNNSSWHNAYFKIKTFPTPSSYNHSFLLHTSSHAFSLFCRI